ncbi:MAG: hypothetical protein N4A35_06775 [Flavobacteriales bacterium]|jgi:hypothetical protein|nr:hypothetical protein [Flavobacteriales bacterium]
METLKKFCQQQGYSYHFKLTKILAGNGTYDYLEKHFIAFVYKKVKLSISSSYGYQDHSSITFSFKTVKPIPSISIDTYENLYRKLVGVKTPWKISCKDFQLKELTLEQLNVSRLTELANNTSFSPTMSSSNSSNHYEFKTFYTLGKAEEVEHFEKIINFHKALIDHIISRYKLKL